jgi:predicted HTH transcriptional regulator
MKTPIEILSEYQRKVELMREQKTPHKDIQPLQVADILLLRAVIHPTDKKESKEMTRELVKFVCDQGIVTAEEIYSTFGWSDKPVMKRLKVLREFGIIRRESKKYYIATPRLLELRNKYLERVCG